MNDQSTRGAKDAFFSELARIGKAAANPRRLELLDLLLQGEKSVETLADQADLKFANTSAQLKVLKGARLVESRKEGQRVFYRIADDRVALFLTAIRGLGEDRYAEIRVLAERHFSDPDGLAAIDRETLVHRVKAGEVCLIDVRPSSEYEAGHIPGSLSIPITKLEQAAASLPRDREIVAYCRGRYCFYAVEAVTVLRRLGFRAVRFEDSIYEWKQAGLPVAEGPEPGREHLRLVS